MDSPLDYEFCSCSGSLFLIERTLGRHSVRLCANMREPGYLVPLKIGHSEFSRSVKHLLALGESRLTGSMGGRAAPGIHRGDRPGAGDEPAGTRCGAYRRGARYVLRRTSAGYASGRMSPPGGVPRGRGAGAFF